jgi:intein/homing endonuclease
MINHDQLLKDIQSQKFTQMEISQRNNCSTSTVVRAIKAHNLGIGQGKRSYSIWKFKESSESLCYLIGIYITDGWITKQHGTSHPNQIGIVSTTSEIIAHSKICISDLGLRWNERKDARPLLRKGKKPQHGLMIYSTDFATWLQNSCNHKSKIPNFIFDAPLEHQLAFIAGIIDGDGHVTTHGSILIRGVDSWLKTLPRLLEIMAIRSAGLKVSEILPSGKTYYRVSIRRSDFRQIGGWCIVQSKYERILSALDTRRRK